MTRSSAPERLDDLDSSGPEYRRVLDELAWLNRWLGTHARTVAAVRSLGITAPRIVDLGCASGDVLLALRQAFPDAELIGIDGNPTALDVASRRLDATWLQADILASDFQLPPCDVVVSTHFLYHFADASFRDFVQRHPDRAFVVVELERSKLAGVLFQWIVGWFVSTWTLQDGLQALRRAFTRAELQALVPGFDVRPGLVEMVAVRPRQ